MDINIVSTEENIQEIHNNKSIIWKALWPTKHYYNTGVCFMLKIVIYCVFLSYDIHFENNVVGIISPNSTDTIDTFDDFMDIIRKPTPPRLPPSPVQKGITQNILSYFKLI